MIRLRDFLLKRLVTIVSLLSLLALILILWQIIDQQRLRNQPDYTPPLVMTEGDPYLRALMRTISASEAKDEDPYTLLYGGQHIVDLSRHPDRCIQIVSGPNKGNCTTAAGRYQLLSSTWQEKVQKYHPQHQSDSEVPSDSFAPQIQDQVVYAWLRDFDAWGINISQLLQQGNLDEVLKHLSSTWTSLGYGIESNPTTPLLHQIYQKALIEELARAKSQSYR